MRFLLSSLVVLCCLFTACQSEKTYSLEELRNNKYNELGLTVAQDLDRQNYLQIFEQFQDLSAKALEKQLTTQALELHEASYGLYYVANAYAKSDQLDQALLYHQFAAKNYLNPQSYLKLAEREYFVTKNYAQAFTYLHYALEIARDITDNNRSHPVAENIKHNSQHLLEELEKKEFDRESSWTALRAIMTDVVNQHRKMYLKEPL